MYVNCDNVDLQIGEESTCGNYKIRHDGWSTGDLFNYQIANFRLWRFDPYTDLGSDSLDVWYESEGKYYDGDKLHVRYSGAGGDPCEAHYDLEDLTPGELTITGRWKCLVSENTYTGGVRADVEAPLVWGYVRIWDGANQLGDGLTGDDGTFDITVTNPGATGFYVEILPYSGAAHVTKEDGSEYSSYTSQWWYPSPSDTTRDIGYWPIFDDPNHKGAWRIYETIANDAYDRGAWNFLKNKGPGYTPPMVNVTFPSDRTSYNGSERRIRIKTVNYTKALDVVQHEYGHFIMHMVYGTWSVPCPYYHFMNFHSTPACAWHEGWANFFPLAVQNEP